MSTMFIQSYNSLNGLKFPFRKVQPPFFDFVSCHFEIEIAQDNLQNFNSMLNGSKILPKTPLSKFDFLAILPKSIDLEEIVELSNSHSSSPYNVDLLN
jgi:hypothetical protein